ncbi:unnamed protein product [Acanthoscelides obtectus]|uniref:Uncharacterized protein n=1 Tax=Acanthoscelides obtectus TaxID=200917 RepID=A0A9P0KQA8_ACAOB|nr:unnamed protein product [Acanthoscelides obtectus]CAK1655118.1 hypothetical protein AOBTE_LOCUS19036 [Acanthoscelides obtectus]
MSRLRSIKEVTWALFYIFDNFRSKSTNKQAQEVGTTLRINLFLLVWGLRRIQKQVSAAQGRRTIRYFIVRIIQCCLLQLPIVQKRYVLERNKQISNHKQEENFCKINQFLKLFGKRGAANFIKGGRSQRFLILHTDPAIAALRVCQCESSEAQGHPKNSKELQDVTRWLGGQHFPPTEELQDNVNAHLSSLAATFYRKACPQTTHHLAIMGLEKVRYFLTSWNTVFFKKLFALRLPRTQRDLENSIKMCVPESVQRRVLSSLSASTSKQKKGIVNVKTSELGSTAARLLFPSPPLIL